MPARRSGGGPGGRGRGTAHRARSLTKTAVIPRCPTPCRAQYGAGAKDLSRTKIVDPSSRSS